MANYFEESWCLFCVSWVGFGELRGLTTLERLGRERYVAPSALGLVDDCCPAALRWKGWFVAGFGGCCGGWGRTRSALRLQIRGFFAALRMTPVNQNDTGQMTPVMR
jgi:hypothetical protein